MQEVNKEADQDNADAQGHDQATLALPPPYEDASDQSMHDSFKHVSIPPTVPDDDGNAVDIRVDEEEVPDAPLARDHSSLTPVGSTFLTPFRAYRDVLSRAPHSSCQLVRFAKVDTGDGQRNRRSSSISMVADSTSSSAPMAASAPPVSTALTPEDMLEALPHRDAIFFADRMEWCVLIAEPDLRSDGKILDRVALGPDVEVDVFKPLWRFEGDVRIATEEQRRPICAVLPESDGDEVQVDTLEVFERWRSTAGDSLLLSKRGSLSSVVPLALMESFREERWSHPRPGMTGEMQFKDAATTLIKVIGNAANGEVRSLSITGKAMTTKLGIDDISQRILGTLGFSADGKADANGQFSMIQPPDMAQASWQLTMRRAWLEIALWYQFKQAKSMSNTTLTPDLLASVPLLPEYKDPEDYLTRVFAFDRHTQFEVRPGFLPAQAQEAFDFLGADANAVEALVEHCYVANTSGLTLLDKVPFYAALQTVAPYYAQSEADLIQTRLGLEKSHGLFSELDLKQAFSRIGIVDVGSVEHANATYNDDFIVSVYRSTVGNVAANKDEVQALKDALEIIATSRGRPSELVDEVDAPVELDVGKAYSILEVNHDTDDDFISSVFAVALIDDSKSAVECTEALRVIAEERNSTALRKVYRSAIGEVDEWEAIDLEKPIGLNNIGNTCYLNSVLQYFFAIRQLREQVLLASQGETGHEEQAKQCGQDDNLTAGSAVVRVGGRQVSKREIERSRRFVRQLSQLFSNMISSPASAVTPERELAYLALVSSRVEEINDIVDTGTTHSASTPAENVASMQISHPTSGTGTETTLVEEPGSFLPERAEQSTILQSSTKAVHMPSKGDDETLSVQGIDDGQENGIITPPLPSTQVPPPPLPPRPAEKRLSPNEAGQRRNSLMQLGAQQDVSECLDNVMFQVEVALTAYGLDGRDVSGAAKEEAVENDEGWIEDGDLLRRLFLGRTLQRLEVATQEDEQKKRGPSIHTKREVFTILPIDVVEEGRDIYDGLDGFFDEETLVGSEGEPIRRTVTLTDAPAIMQIQLQRVQYDRIKGAYKSQAHLDVGQTLFMDRYLDFDPLDQDDAARLEKRRKGRAARKRIAALRMRLQALEPDKTAVSQTLKQTSDFLSSLGDPKGLQTASEGGRELQNLADVAFQQYLADEATCVQEEVRGAEEEIAALKAEVEKLWADERRIEYTLASVFMHRGEASHGHYFLNQRKLTALDKEPSTIWYKYNDQTISEVAWSEVHHDQSSATPYLLCWVRRDKLDHFDTLCRASVAASSLPAPMPADAEQQQDVTMTDA